VPLHPLRQYRRGFNQARELAIHLGPPVIPLLRRVRHTRSQIDLPKHERHLNVQDAFALIDRPEGLSIVVLVDDVSTTGATLDACASVLKATGIREVRALTAARVVNERR
jgi:predicted amidophosphoribosyltransferase